MLYHSLFFIGTFYVYNLFEYIFHRLGHIRNKYNIFYISHIKHHKLYYPANRFVRSDVHSDREGLKVYTPLALFVLYIFYNILNYYYFIFFTSEIFILFLINDYIHNQIHLKDSWLERYNWFIKCRELHYIHHKKFINNSSFSNIDTTIDKLFNTFIEN